MSRKPSAEHYTPRTTPTVRRAFAERLPEAVAVAAYKFMTGPLVREPYRVGKHRRAVGCPSVRVGNVCGLVSSGRTEANGEEQS